MRGNHDQKRRIKVNKEALIGALLGCEMDLYDQQSRLVDMRYHIDTERDEDLAKIAREFSKFNEEMYLRLKIISYLIQGKRPCNMAEEIGTTESFPSRLENLEKGIWKFTLPPFYSVSPKNRLYNEGKHMYYLVLNLLMQYEKTHKKIRTMGRPGIIFRHHICTDIRQPFDHDNIDAKRAIDAMQGYFFQDDNALELVWHSEAIEDSEMSLCEIYVVDMDVTGPVLSEKITKKIN